MADDGLITFDVWAHRLKVCELEHGPLPPHAIYLAFTEWPMRYAPGGVVYGDIEDAKAKTRAYDAEEHAWLEANCPSADVHYLPCKREREFDLGTVFEGIPDFVAVRVIFPDEAQRETFLEAFPDYRPKAA